jgi:hypothetical protein
MLNEKRLRRFSASRMFELLAEGKGKSRLKYIYDLGAEALGIDRNVSTKEKEHGIRNQYDAYQLFKKYKGECGWWDEPIPYANNLVASPDVVSSDYVADMKCQFSIITFEKQNKKLEKKYFLQSQTQMLCAEKEIGYIANYLSRPQFYNVEWEEYSIPEPDRLYLHKIERDEKIIKKIIDYANIYHPYIETIENMLKGATEVNDEEFFYLQRNSQNVEELRNIDWTENKKPIFRYFNKFFVELDVSLRS